MTLLAFRDVCKRFPDGVRETVVMDRVSFALDTGETIGLLGLRGAGKTTLLRLAAGMELSDGGAVYWDGRDLAHMGVDQRARIRRRRGVALASGDWQPLESISVIEHMTVPIYTAGVTMREAEACAQRALAMVDASHLGHRAIDTLGQRERLRVGLARALAQEPRLLLVDEPAILPRAGEAREFYALLHSLPRQIDVALLIASEEVAAVSGMKRVMSLDNGRLRSTEDRGAVLSFPKRRVGSHGNGSSAS